MHTFLSLVIFHCVKKCPLTAVSQLGGNERRALVRPPFLDPSPRRASSAFLDKAAWSFRVLPGDAVVSGSASDEQYSEPFACRIGTVAPSDILICRFCFFPIATGLGKNRGMSFEPAQWSFKVDCSVRSPASPFTPEVHLS